MSKGILTKREKEVFSLLIENKTTREIANILSISEKTVRNHISNKIRRDYFIALYSAFSFGFNCEYNRAYWCIIYRLNGYKWLGKTIDFPRKYQIIIKKWKKVIFSLDFNIIIRYNCRSVTGLDVRSCWYTRLSCQIN